MKKSSPIQNEALRFLYSGPDGEYFSEIQKLVRKSKKIDIAVAFWGQGAAEELGLNNADKKIRIVCSLKNGISNPEVINKLMEIHGNEAIRQYENLHAKVFIFDKKVAVVGSANVSTFGLPSTELEMERAWMEAAVLVKEPVLLKEIIGWFDEKIWENAINIFPSDLAKARLDRQNLAGRARPITLFNYMSRGVPGVFDDPSWRMEIHTEEEFSEEAEQDIIEAREEEGIPEDDENHAAYEWGDPGGIEKGMGLISFHVPEEEGQVTYGGIWVCYSIHGKIQRVRKKTGFFPERTENRVIGKWTDFIRFIINQRAGSWDSWLNDYDSALLLPINEVLILLQQHR